MPEIKLNIVADIPTMKTLDMNQHKMMANAIRALAMDAVQKANSGHPGMPMGMADIATVLYTQFLKFNPQDPSWPDRDRFVLSNGHGSMLLYALNYLTGYEKMTLEEIKNFRQLGAQTAGHPEHDLASGIETTTGPLGQGLGNAVGMALAERMMKAHFGEGLVNHYTYVFAGDGCLSEGISQEVISFAGHQKLSNLIVFFDDNHITIDGPTSLSISDNHLMRFQASGWHTQQIDGHDPVAIAEAIKNAQAADQPSLIACRTVIGYGSPHKAGKSSSHGSPLGEEEIIETKKQLGWTGGPFEVPQDILDHWRGIAQKSHSLYAQWQDRYNQANADVRSEFDRRMAGKLPQQLDQTIQQMIHQWLEQKPSSATRQLSQDVLDAVTGSFPELIGGSADLTGSNNTKAKIMEPITAESAAGQYIYYGVREHGMAAIMNGMALHGGIIPFGGTFLTFSDYCRPAIRLSALMKQRVIYVMTHDSIGLGEDGPTHQPVEHLASLRAIPHLQVFRPADAVEVAECWQAALESADAPSIIVLTRQKVSALRHAASSENMCAKGAYILAEAQGERQVTLLATGSEVELALGVQQALAVKGIAAAVVSMPSWERFDAQSKSYQQQVLGSDDHLHVSIEAASTFGWERYIGRDGLACGLTTFGASAPAEALYKYFGLTVDQIVPEIMEKLQRGGK